MGQDFREKGARHILTSSSHSLLFRLDAILTTRLFVFTPGTADWGADDCAEVKPGHGSDGGEGREGRGGGGEAAGRAPRRRFPTLRCILGFIDETADCHFFTPVPHCMTVFTTCSLLLPLTQARGPSSQLPSWSPNTEPSVSPPHSSPPPAGPRPLLSAPLLIARYRALSVSGRALHVQGADREQPGHMAGERLPAGCLLLRAGLLQG